MAMHDSTTTTTTTIPSSSITPGARSPSSGAPVPLASPTAGFGGSLLASPSDDGGGAASTANSSVASTPTGEIEADPALLMPAPDDMPYFPEKYPGKQCILCNLGERSQLGQGEMLRIEMTLAADQIASALSQEDKSHSGTNGTDAFGDKSPRANSLLGPPQLGSSKRQKGSNKCKNPIPNAEYTDELEKIGHLEVLDSSISDGGYFYVHRSCALWSYGVGRDPVSGTLSNLELMVVQSLSRRCHFCTHYGASLSCKMSCPKWYHFPCVAASGGFQVIQTYNIFCKEHLGQVPLVCAEDINCRQCSALGDVGNLVMCSICGDHYHGTCVGLAQLPGVRTGWQCNSCKKCQICRVPDSSEGRSVACELLRQDLPRELPAPGHDVDTEDRLEVPLLPGVLGLWGAHARRRGVVALALALHRRNKGFSCPICHRAYRAAAHREMVKCSVCYKFVHSTCDPDAELSVYNARKEANPDYEYLCSPCKTVIHSGRLAAALRRTSSVDEDGMSGSQDSANDDAMDVDGPEGRESVRDRLERSGSGSLDVGLGKGKPYVASKIAKKRLGLSLSGGLAGSRPKGLGKGFQKKSRLADITRKRGSKAKMRGIFGVPGLGLQRPTADQATAAKASEEEPGGENRLVLCSAKDKFVLTQDICVMCGAIGTDQEGCLISCTQCGQCYHPYCTNVKVTKVILQKGWRCLDCTICEGCGQRHDEARLILCDDCDISYHTYCMDPPLEQVPQGTWKCKWCAMCLKCGANSPGFNCAWMNAYTECGPCASQSSCPSCSEGYAEGELIIPVPPAEFGKRGKRKPKLPPVEPQAAEKDAGILAAIESVVAGSSHDNSLEEMRLEPLDPREEAEIYKDGMVWNDPTPPEGFALFTTETGTVVLRKKRQRNLQKLGIGGFFVRNRGIRTKDGKDDEDLVDGLGEDGRAEDGQPGGSSNKPKKKPIRRKPKSKLIEIYPSILQDAFFGRTLLAANAPLFEAPASDEEAKSDVSDDKTVKLSAEELKLFEAVKSKEEEVASAQAKEHSDAQPGVAPSTASAATAASQVGPLIKSQATGGQQGAAMPQHPGQRTATGGGGTSQSQPGTPGSSAAPPPPSSAAPSPAAAAAAMSSSGANNAAGGFTANGGPAPTKMEEDETSDTEGLNDVLGLPNDLIEEDFVSQIMTEDELIKHSAAFDELATDPELTDTLAKSSKDELVDMLSPHFDLTNIGQMDSKVVEEIFKTVLTDESQESQESMLASSMTPYTSNTSTPSHSADQQQQQQQQMGNPMAIMPQPHMAGQTAMGGQMMLQQQQQPGRNGADD
uniref:PHD-type domain-containing protein n=1 Tax=Anopheles coluzzii TaxID=1518534 RepID=A0A8W7PV76_ANOCL